MYPRSVHSLTSSQKQDIRTIDNAKQKRVIVAVNAYHLRSSSYVFNHFLVNGAEGVCLHDIRPHFLASLPSIACPGVWPVAVCQNGELFRIVKHVHTPPAAGCLSQVLCTRAGQGFGFRCVVPGHESYGHLVRRNDALLASDRAG